jgi:hypothetical protein
MERAATFRINERGTSMHSGLLGNVYYAYKMLFSMWLVYLRHRHEQKGRAR